MYAPAQQQDSSTSPDAASAPWNEQLPNQQQLYFIQMQDDSLSLPDMYQEANSAQYYTFPQSGTPQEAPTPGSTDVPLSAQQAEYPPTPKQPRFSLYNSQRKSSGATAQVNASSSTSLKRARNNSTTSTTASKHSATALSSTASPTKTRVSISFKNIAAFKSDRASVSATSAASFSKPLSPTSPVKRDAVKRDQHVQNLPTSSSATVKAALKLDLNRKLRQRIAEKNGLTMGSSCEVGNTNSLPEPLSCESDSAEWGCAQQFSIPTQALECDLLSQQPNVGRKNSSDTSSSKSKRREKKKQRRNEELKLESDPEDAAMEFNMHQQEQQMPSFIPFEFNEQQDFHQNMFSGPFNHTSTSNSLPFGYQMLYVPVQMPSPSDPLLSPLQNLSSTPPRSKTSDHPIHSQIPTPTSSIDTTPSKSAHSNLSRTSSQTEPLSKAVSFTSLFHPTLQSQLSNSKLFAQLGFSMSTPTMGGFMSTGSVLGSGASPVIGVFLPSNSSHNLETCAAFAQHGETREKPSAHKEKDTFDYSNAPPASSSSSAPGWNSQAVYFLQQKQIQRAMQDGKMDELENTVKSSLPEMGGAGGTNAASAVGGGDGDSFVQQWNDCTLSPKTQALMRSASLSFMNGLVLPFQNGQLPGSQDVESLKCNEAGNIVTEHAGSLKRRRSSRKGKEPMTEEEDLAASSSAVTDDVKTTSSPLLFLFKQVSADPVAETPSNTSNCNTAAEQIQASTDWMIHSLSPGAMASSIPPWGFSRGLSLINMFPLNSANGISDSSASATSTTDLIPLKGLPSAMLAPDYNGSVEETNLKSGAGHLLIPVAQLMPGGGCGSSGEFVSQSTPPSISVGGWVVFPNNLNSGSGSLFAGAGDGSGARFSPTQLFGFY
ncbi:hypothetical protein HDU80_009785 [Chytriomyces hyalinus]|nr:hypothetical protein HDU80_009785 [Chytriomyces hyalinus]